MAQDNSPYVSNDEMVQYTTNAIDVWSDTLGALVGEVADELDEVNGEFVGGGLIGRAEYINITKQMIRDVIITCGVNVPLNTPFRRYPDYIKQIKTSTISINSSVEHKQRKSVVSSADIKIMALSLSSVIEKSGSRIEHTSEVCINIDLKEQQIITSVRKEI